MTYKKYIIIVCAHKVFLEHGHAHSFMNCLWWASSQRLYGPMKSKILILWSLMEKVCQPLILMQRFASFLCCVLSEKIDRKGILKELFSRPFHTLFICVFFGGGRSPYSLQLEPPSLSFNTLTI